VSSRYARTIPGPTHGAIVLCYHAVSDDWPSPLAIGVRQLERQIQALRRRRYRFLTFGELVAQVSSGRPARKIAAITFDDGYESTWTRAHPLLQRLGAPATVFVPTHFIETGKPLRWPGIEEWSNTAHAHELRPLTLAQLRALAAAGWEVGSHTVSHPRLPVLTDDRLADELARSKAWIEERLERPCETLAYPYGAYDERVIAAAQAAGYRAAGVLTGRLPAPRPLAWPRIGVFRVDRGLRFLLKSHPWSVWARSTGAWALLRPEKSS